MTEGVAKFATRSNENSRRTWTLTSLAVRVAQALGIHQENCASKYTSPYRPFEREMRRRLWWQICILDTQASVDRGSDPIITTNSFSAQPPLHVNDDDLIPGDPREVRPRDEYTDTTISLVCHEVFDVLPRLASVPNGGSDCSPEGPDRRWAQREDWVLGSQRHIEVKYLRYCNMAVPAQRYTILIADIILATMWLMAYRPLQRHPDSHTPFNTRHPGILNLSVQVIEKSMQVSMDTPTQSFRWISSIWVQWHALAVTIAELCVQTEGPTVERAWAVVNIAFEEIARHVADSEKGRLWRPIKKLMNRAQAVRRKHLEDVTAKQRTLPSAGVLQPAHPTFLWPNTQISQLDMMGTGAEPMLSSDTTGLLQQPQPSVPSTEPMPIDWDQWLATVPSNLVDHKNELNQMAWTNWESFIDDFQANGDFLLG